MTHVTITSLKPGDQITYCTEWRESCPPQPGKVERGTVASIVQIRGGEYAIILAGPEHYTLAPRGPAYKGPVLRQGDVLDVTG